MLYLKIVGQIALFLIAVVALFGATSINHKLTRLGKGLLALISIAATFNLAALVVEKNEELRKELDLVKAKETVYSRLVGDIEEAKNAFLWVDYDFLAKPAGFFDYKNVPSIFMSQNKSQLSKMEGKLISPLDNSVRSMSLAYETNREYLSFEAADSLSHFLQTIKAMNFYSILSRYESSHGSFSDYLIENNLHHDRLEYLFLSLYALEKDVKSAKLENEKRFYELRPECKDPDDIEIMLSCI